MFRRFLSYLLWGALSVLACLLLYGGAFWVLSSLPAHSAQKRASGEIAIFVRSDEFHTDILLPAKTVEKDWLAAMHFESLTSSPEYLAFGWGDRGFYLGTPTSSEFQASLALKAIFYMGTAVVHISAEQSAKAGEQCHQLWLTRSEYVKLVQFIEKAFLCDEAGKLRPIAGHHYGKRHLFYEAKGAYSLFYTCNTWVGEGLKTCRQPTCVWTPFASGLLYHLKP